MVPAAAPGRGPTPVPGRERPATVSGVDESITRTPTPESPFDVGQFVVALRRTPGGWLLPSTWRATANVLLWIGTSYLLALIALGGLLASLVTGWTTGPAVAVRALMLQRLTDAIELDCRRTNRFAGVRIAPFPLPRVAHDASPAARQQAWVQSPLRWRLPAYALIRALTASAVVAVAVAWWWVTIVLHRHRRLAARGASITIRVLSADPCAR